MEKLIDLLAHSHYCVAFTGAGVSTLSGVRDFRGTTGVYNQFDGNKLFSIDYFRRDPSYFYAHAKELVYDVADKQPSIVHLELARLHQKGLVKKVITQNIDLLHQKAGIDDVIELHGSAGLHHCQSCHREYPFEEIRQVVQRGETPACVGCRGVIKPDITFFGEMLDEESIDQAVQHSAQADCMLALGSSLVVQPAASMPLYTKQNGGKLVIVNDMPTPLDDLADLRYRDLQEVFSFIRDRL
jgi:NAD-dependent deacetylase